MSIKEMIDITGKRNITLTVIGMLAVVIVWQVLASRHTDNVINSHRDPVPSVIVVQHGQPIP